MNNNIETSTDEIDLIQLIFDLWKRKITILVVTLFFAIGSIGYALIAPQVWTAKSLLIKPDTQSVAKYLLNIKKYNSSLGFDAGTFTPEQIFAKYEQELTSVDLQKQFFKTTSLFNSFIVKGMSEHEALKLLLDNLKIVKPENKKGEISLDNLSVTFSADNPEVAQKMLQSFLDYVQESVYRRVLGEYDFQIQMKKVALEAELKNIHQGLTAIRNIKIENLSNALTIARNAGIKNYIEKFDDKILPMNVNNDALINIQDSSMFNNNFLFLLGEKYLAAQLHTLENKGLEYPERYYDIQYKLNILSTFSIKSDELKFAAFNYQESPTYPINRDKPKRGLIVIAGTFVGVVLGILLALLLNAIHNYKVNLNRRT